MSCILYYSKYCEVSKKYLQLLSKSDIQKDIHFICIDKRVKDSNNKTYIILELPVNIRIIFFNYNYFETPLCVFKK